MIELFTTPVPNEVAVERLKALAPVTREQFDRLLPELRAQAFTVTGLEDANVLQRLRDIVAELPAGGSWDEVKAKVVAEISPWIAPGSVDQEEQARQDKAAASRAELILRTHGFRAYAAARYRDQKANADIEPWWEYRSFGDARVRDTHAALDGVILAHDDKFWDTHYPPWDWGCRCIVIGVGNLRYEMVRAADEQKPVDERNTFEGRRLEELRNGRLIRGPGKNYDVRPPIDKATTKAEKAAAWNFRPGEVKPSLAALRGRYSPKVWREFEGFARKAKLPDGRTVWNWAGGDDIIKSTDAPPPPAPAEGAVATWDQSLEAAGIQEKDLDTWTEKNIQRLVKALKKLNAAKVDEVIDEVFGKEGFKS